MGRRELLGAVLLCSAVMVCVTAPVEQSLQQTLTEEEDDTLLLLVPSVPISKRSAVDQISEVWQHI